MMRRVAVFSTTGSGHIPIRETCVTQLQCNFPDLQAIIIVQPEQANGMHPVPCTVLPAERYP
ncbi:MAG: hypothetical protein RIC38_10375 [Chromatocurvus sp.]